LKSTVIGFLCFIGIPELVRRILQKNKTTIIYYHNISKEKFSKHLNFLTKKYSIISLDDYLNQTIQKDKKYRLIITLDDGYKENKELQEILSSHQLSATVFLTAGIVNTDCGLWFQSDIPKEEKKRLKKIPNHERIDFLVKNDIFVQNSILEERTSLNLDEIKAMNNFSFGSHTMYHPCLASCSDEESYKEIANSKIHLEKLLDRPIQTLAFPDGSFTNREIDYSKQGGYKAVLTSLKGFNEFESGSFVLKRFSIVDSCSVNELFLRTTGVWFILRKILRY
jgi:peptidoglycan/xylan/chitin deacetylase (PgdA/CDA1 family)